MELLGAVHAANGARQPLILSGPQQYGVSRQAITEAVRRYKAIREERA